MAYVTVKGGEQAIDNAHAWLAEERRGDPTVPELSLAQIEGQLGRSVDRAMGEGSLYDRELAALAVKQAQGDLIEAAFLLRAYRTTLPRFAHALPVDTAAMRIRRRISAVFKDLPGGQVLGPTYDYTHRLLDFGLADGGGDVAAPRTDEAMPAMPRVPDILGHEGLIEPDGAGDAEPGDLTRQPLSFPATRDVRLQALARGDEGFLLALGYSTQRGYGGTHPFAGEIRMGEVSVEIEPPELGLRHRHRRHHGHRMPDGQPVQGLEDHAAAVHPRLWAGVRLLRAQGDGDGAGRSGDARGGTGRRGDRAGTERGVRAVPLGQYRGDRVRRASEAAALRRFPERAGERAPRCEREVGQRKRDEVGDACGGTHAPMKGYNFAYLDEQTKRMIRRSLLKAVAIPGHQVPFGSREMPLPYGWGTGGIQVTASVLGAGDVLKVIDQGADDTTNAVSIRRFFARTAGVRTTTRTTEATVIQTRHRIPEKTLRDDQIIVYQVPQPEPLYRLESSRIETRRMHALADYGLMHVKLYEDVARFGQISISYDYPVMVNHRHLMSPSPIPAFDNPKMHLMPALQLFGAGREKRIYAIPPWTDVRSLDFDDHPFRADPRAASVRAVRRDRTRIWTKW